MWLVRRAAGAVFAGLFLAAAGRSSGAGGEEVRYNRDVRPILAENCFQCHGPDRAQRKAKLRLDVREEAVAKGAWVPGRPEDSGVWKRLTSADPEEVMPPPASHKTVGAAQREVLRRWIAAGAIYETHWSYAAVARPPVPESGTGQGPRRGSVHPVDAFIRERLEREGLEPAPEAGRAVLLRRLGLDLVGLPPSPAELRAFERDTSRDAYERQVERLLASPHFGERMAVAWFDAVRFTDTVGYHGDQNARIFPYRDYVIDAFNRNLPFDRFTVEQLAGDLLPSPTVAQRVATGCNRLNMMTREGGAQPKEYLAKYQADRVRTVATAWLGATMACAECHDHKYDPFTMRDFYSMAAYFADLQQWGVYSDYPYTPNPDLAGWSNDHPFPPEIEVESPYLRQRIETLNAASRKLAVEAIERAESEGEDGLRRWRRATADFLRRHPDGWQTLRPRPDGVMVGTNRSPDRYTIEADGAVRFAVEGTSHDTFEWELPVGTWAALRLELLPDTGRSNRIVRGTRNGMTLEVAARLRHRDETERGLGFRFADANLKEPRYTSTEDSTGIHRGWRTASARPESRHDSVWLWREPTTAVDGDVLVVTLRNCAAARVRMAVSPLALEPEYGDPVAGYARLAGRLPRGEALPSLHLGSTAWNKEAFGQWSALQAKAEECRYGRAWTQVSVSTNALVTRVLPRGNWMDESGPVVTASPPAFLGGAGATMAVRGMADDRFGWGDGGGGKTHDGTAAGRAGTRLELAHWLVSRENPLTARNLVNRLWAQFFGAGLSARLEDLGLQGEWPTHPELLDWLAAEFMEPRFRVESGRRVPAARPWDVKHLVRVLVTSAAYRQSCEPSEKARDLDPANRLLARQNPRRLEAEFVRDNALAAAGLIDLSVGGPSVFPYQPAGYYANLQFPDRDYRASPDERQYRRGVYMHWQRTFLHPMLANFDAQSREECVAARLVSNTPQQALTLLNDPTFVEAARVLAAVAVRSAKTDDERLDVLFVRALGRVPRPAERKSLTVFLAGQRRHFAASIEAAGRLVAVGQAPVAKDLAAPELAAWTGVARVVLNLHETITRY